MRYLIQPKIIAVGSGEKGRAIMASGFAQTPPIEVREESGLWLGREGEGVDYAIPHRIYTAGIHRRDLRMTLRTEGDGAVVTFFREQSTLPQVSCLVFVVTGEGRIKKGGRVALNKEREMANFNLEPGEGLRIAYPTLHKGKPTGVYIAVDLYPEGQRYHPEAEVPFFGEVPTPSSWEKEPRAFAVLSERLEGAGLPPELKG